MMRERGKNFSFLELTSETDAPFAINGGKGERNGRGDWIRTSDPSVPNAVRYQLRHTPTFGLLILPAALCPVKPAAHRRALFLQVTREPACYNDLQYALSILPGF